MRVYLYSYLLKIIFVSLLSIAFIPSVICFLCFLLADQTLNAVSLIFVFSCLLIRLFLEMAIFILNKKAKNSIFFENGKILYKGKTIHSANIKYFKFHLSFIEPSLVIPKMYINTHDSSVTVYVSKKDVKRLKKMGFEIKEI